MEELGIIRKTREGVYEIVVLDAALHELEVIKLAKSFKITSQNFTLLRDLYLVIGE